MSRTTMYVVRENGDIENYEEFSNACRGALLVWIKLAEKYNIQDANALLFKEEKSKEVWGLASKDGVDPNDQITMKTTFDRVIVKQEDLRRVVDAMKETAKTLPPHCSVLEQAEAMENLIGDASVVGVCWNQTSVVQVWSKYYSDETETYNLGRDDAHWYMFGEQDTPQEDVNELTTGA